LFLLNIHKWPKKMRGNCWLAQSMWHCHSCYCLATHSVAKTQ